MFIAILIQDSAMRVTRQVTFGSSNRVTISAEDQTTETYSPSEQDYITRGGCGKRRFRP